MIENDRKCYAKSWRGRKHVKIVSVLRESNSKSILCLLDEAALCGSYWSPDWTAEDHYVHSRYISCPLAALSAEVHIGSQSLYTGYGDLNENVLMSSTFLKFTEH